jgi:hypothetical protein
MILNKTGAPAIEKVVIWSGSNRQKFCHFYEFSIDGKFIKIWCKRDKVRRWGKHRRKPSEISLRRRAAGDREGK